MSLGCHDSHGQLLVSRGRLYAGEVGVAADIRHIGQHIGKAASDRSRQGCHKDVTMLRLWRAPIEGGANFQSTGQSVVDASDKQIRHGRSSDWLV